MLNEENRDEKLRENRKRLLDHNEAIKTTNPTSPENDNQIDRRRP